MTQWGEKKIIKENSFLYIPLHCGVPAVGCVALQHLRIPLLTKFPINMPVDVATVTTDSLLKWQMINNTLYLEFMTSQGSLHILVT